MSSSRYEQASRVVGELLMSTGDSKVPEAVPSPGSSRFRPNRVLLPSPIFVEKARLHPSVNLHVYGTTFRATEKTWHFPFRPWENCVVRCAPSLGHVCCPTSSPNQQ